MAHLAPSAFRLLVGFRRPCEHADKTSVALAGPAATHGLITNLPCGRTILPQNGFARKVR